MSLNYAVMPPAHPLLIRLHGARHEQYHLHGWPHRDRSSHPEICRGYLRFLRMEVGLRWVDQLTGPV